MKEICSRLYSFLRVWVTKLKDALLCALPVKMSSNRIVIFFLWAETRQKRGRILFRLCIYWTRSIPILLVFFFLLFFLY